MILHSPPLASYGLAFYRIVAWTFVPVIWSQRGAGSGAYGSLPAHHTHGLLLRLFTRGSQTPADHVIPSSQICCTWSCLDRLMQQTGYSSAGLHTTLLISHSVLNILGVAYAFMYVFLSLKTQWEEPLVYLGAMLCPCGPCVAKSLLHHVLFWDTHTGTDCPFCCMKAHVYLTFGYSSYPQQVLLDSRVHMVNMGTFCWVLPGCTFSTRRAGGQEEGRRPSTNNIACHALAISRLVLSRLLQQYVRAATGGRQWRAAASAAARNDDAAWRAHMTA